MAFHSKDSLGTEICVGDEVIVLYETKQYKGCVINIDKYVTIQIKFNGEPFFIISEWFVKRSLK